MFDGAGRMLAHPFERRVSLFEMQDISRGFLSLFGCLLAA